MAYTNIKAGGVSQRDLVDLLYQIVSSIAGMCAKLDADTGVPLETYTANCYTAIIKTVIEDSKGNRTGVGGGKIITPQGLTQEALIQVLYEIFLSWDTLMAQLDADTLSYSNFEALYYTATFLWNVTNGSGTTQGLGTGYHFGPNSAPDELNLINILYAVVNSIYLACVHLDADGTVTDTDYTDLWYTANILTIIQNSAGSTIGNAKPY
jgi:hypothetical protein